MDRRTKVRRDKVWRRKRCARDQVERKINIANDLKVDLVHGYGEYVRDGPRGIPNRQCDESNLD